MKNLALTVPGDGGTSVNISPPANIPEGTLLQGGYGNHIVNVAIELLLALIAIISLFFIIYGGFKWLSSGGEEEKILGGRQTIIYAILGLTLSLLSFAIMKVLGEFFGVNLLAF